MFKKIKEISKITIGKTPSTNNSKFWKNGEVYWYTVYDISNNLLYPKKLISFLAIKENNQPLTNNNSLLYSMVRYIKPFIPIENSSFNQGIAKIDVNTDIILRKYLYYNFIFNKRKINSLRKGSTFPSINSYILSNLIIFIPSIEKQQRIIDIIEPFEKLAEIYEKLIKLINNLFSLITKLYSLQTKEKLLSYFNFIKGTEISSSKRTKNIENKLVKYIRVGDLTFNSERQSFIVLKIINFFVIIKTFY